HCRDTGVLQLPIAERDASIDEVAHQSMRKPVLPDASRQHEFGFDRRLKLVSHLVSSAIDVGREQIDVELVSDDRRVTQNIKGTSRQGAQPAIDGITDCLGQTSARKSILFQNGASLCTKQSHDFGEKERVSPCAGCKESGDPFGWRRTGRIPNEPANLNLGKTL